MENPRRPPKVLSFCSFRYGLSFLLHLCNVITIAQNTSLSLTMVVMVNHTEPHSLTNFSANQLPADIKNPVYDWSPDIQGIILSSAFYGSLLVHIPIGYISGIYSIKKTVGSAMLLCSLLNLLIPLAANLGKTTIILCRVLQGIAQNIVATGQHEIWVRWAPPLERGRLTSISLSGFVVGPFIALLVTGLICQALGWPMVFYIFGACGCALCLPWFILVYDDPKDHPCISISEKEYITSSTIQQFSSKRQSVPIKAMLKSLPFWAISIGNLGYHWTNTTMILYSPMFINSMFDVNIRENGWLSALPYLFAWIFGILAGQMSDFFQSRNIFSLLTIRKLFTSLGLLLPALFSVCLLYLSHSFLSTIIFLILIIATQNFNTVGTFLNALDIAPRYYGFLRGVTTFLGLMGGLISSTLTGIILNQDPETSWFKVFILLSAINVGSSIFYLVFAAVEVQDWARDREQTRF
ncbi:sodium-dependent phosphate transport protein 1-like [Dasypus novemcinctus]|uniref:sodium-dependent phosphate transport protein 1-like n=1 Tax=Dasypus novemcinctus TaxID=9361 RepID=UPI000328F158|nr:sodium-dependent phosphate transport protein 1-like [Dasypus novemcinctus]